MHPRTRKNLVAIHTRLYWQSSGLTRTSHRRQGSRLRVSRARGFMKEKGIGVRGISTKVWDWLIQTLTERLHVSKRASGLCSCGLGAYLCSHSNQLMYDFTQRQGAVDRGEVPARWCRLRQDSLACVLAFFFIFTVKSPALASGLLDNSFT